MRHPICSRGGECQRQSVTSPRDHKGPDYFNETVNSMYLYISRLVLDPFSLVPNAELPEIVAVNKSNLSGATGQGPHGKEHRPRAAGLYLSAIRSFMDHS